MSPTTAAPGESLPPRPPPVPGWKHVVFGLGMLFLAAVCIALDAEMFAKGFTVKSDNPLIDWGFVSAQAVFGLLVVPGMVVFAAIGLRIFLLTRWLKQRFPSAGDVREAGFGVLPGATLRPPAC